MSHGNCCCAWKNCLALLGRVIIGAFFLTSGLMKIKFWGDMSAAVTNIELPYPLLFLGIAIALEILGGISLILGYKTRVGALFLIVFLATATYLFHGFWNIDASQAHAVREEFVRNVVYLGALFYVAAFGPGSYSVDAVRCCKNESCK